MSFAFENLGKKCLGEPREKIVQRTKKIVKLEGTKIPFNMTAFLSHNNVMWVIRSLQKTSKTTHVETRP